MNDHDGLTYVYAAAPDTRRLRSELLGVRGVSGAPVSLLGLLGESESQSDDVPGSTPRTSGTEDAVAFVISRVAPHEFDERALKQRFEDLEWLEGVARAHNEVVQTIARHDTVLPLRLATVYQNDDRARRALVAQRHAFAERIDLLRGQSEFGVKLYVTAATPSEETRDDAAAGSGDTAALSPGKAYLRRRRAQHTAQESRYLQAQQAAERIDALAARFTPHCVRHPAQRGALAGPDENVLNDAYLVPDDQADAFRAAVTAAAQDIDGVRIDVTGPWAPYSFAMPAPKPPSLPPDEDRDGRVP
ncbi:GvpL/GvpF family gas vesicle protein [Streptomyces sp. NPDC056549]|uniref:GvpL/GvpF family gas vesicle protein n=1 Tax=Streptomyces sp. NPDC056549 TaxID=3345864 RepID=UPI003684705F